MNGIISKRASKPASSIASRSCVNRIHGQCPTIIMCWIEVGTRDFNQQLNPNPNLVLTKPSGGDRGG